MEEDIKRTECLIERCSQCKLNECINCEISWTEVQAIENTIKRCRELERTVKIKNGDIEYLQNKINKHFISDTKIQKKIEELKKEYEIALEENSTKAFILKCQIDILEKLMEDK